ncbi:MAG: GNAT family N-acetyltransferase [Amaricoccus sp.]|uniref:GNAT family N-acetyltransferase n=1 Tax=Amaricoccus sp. TaxID=1872485 RepID=UPI00331470E9
MIMNSPVTIRRAVYADAPSLPAIENSAGTVFRELPDLAWLADGEDLPVSRYRELIAGGASWLAECERNPVGFLCASVEGDALHVWEFGVLRERQGQGIGGALLKAAIMAARHLRLAAVTLTTFRNVAWNAPFYARSGFRIVDGTAIDTRLAERLRQDAERGLPSEPRCAMCLALG